MAALADLGPVSIMSECPSCGHEKPQPEAERAKQGTDILGALENLSRLKMRIRSRAGTRCHLLGVLHHAYQCRSGEWTIVSPCSLMDQNSRSGR